MGKRQGEMVNLISCLTLLFCLNVLFSSTPLFYPSGLHAYVQLSACFSLVTMRVLQNPFDSTPFQPFHAYSSEKSLFGSFFLLSLIVLFVVLFWVMFIAFLISLSIFLLPIYSFTVRKCDNSFPCRVCIYQPSSLLWFSVFTLRTELRSSFILSLDH